MSNEKFNAENGKFERRDLSAGGVLGFLGGLGIVGVLIYLILGGVYGFLNRYEKAHEPRQNPLIGATNTDTRHPTAQDAAKFPLPRLETSERGQLDDQRIREEEILNSYGWLDQKAGIAHIPIERAMALIVEHGLPTAPQHFAAGAEAPIEAQRHAAHKATKATGKTDAKQ
jgi:hypothetical protein